MRHDYFDLVGGMVFSQRCHDETKMVTLKLHKENTTSQGQS